MTRSSLCIILIFFSCGALASNEIDGLFGIALGKPYATEAGELVKGNLNEPMSVYRYNIDPIAGYSVFASLDLTIHNQSGKVASIKAEKIYENRNGCRSSMLKMIKILESEFGTAKEVGEFLPYLFRSKNDERAANVSCAPVEADGSQTLSVVALDWGIILNIEKEYSTRKAVY